MARRHEPLSQSVTVAEWWKNRRGELIGVCLSAYEGRNLADVRTLVHSRGWQAETRQGFCGRNQTPAALGGGNRQKPKPRPASWA